MPKYFYKCPKCADIYIEQRPVEESQYHTRCNKCKEADYEEVSKEILAPEPERFAASDPVEPTE